LKIPRGDWRSPADGWRGTDAPYLSHGQRPVAAFGVALRIVGPCQS
jgi:hypothetical protein